MGIANIINNSTTTSGGEIVRELVNSSDGAGLHFDGASSYISLANNAAAHFGLSDFSIEFILNQTQASTDETYYFLAPYTGDNRMGLWYDKDNSTLKIFFRKTSNTHYPFDYDMANDFGTPTHYVVTADRNGLATLYKNGNSVASVDISASSDADIGNTNPTYISNNSTSTALIGSIYRFRAFNTLADAKLLFERADVPQTLTANLLFDLDLAFANPTQSLTVQDRKGNTDGTASTSGVTQVQPIIQGNLTSLAVTTSQQAAGVPADGEVIQNQSTILCADAYDAGLKLTRHGTSEHAYIVNKGGALWVNAKSGNSTKFIDGNDNANVHLEIKGDGNVGISQTPSAWAGTGKALQLAGASHVVTANNYAYIGSNYYYENAWKYTTAAKAAVYTQSDGTHDFRVATAGSSAGDAITWNTALTINNSGAVGFGVTSGQQSASSGSGGLFYNGAGSYLSMARSGDTAILVNRISDTGEVIEFRKDGADVGNISVTASATAFNTSSDYRLKENLEPLTGALDRIDQLPVYRFNFTADPDTTVDGFVAHEVQAHVPEAITGEKDGMKTVEIPAVLDEDGNELEAARTEEQPDYQGIDQSKLVPLLVAAVKELKAKVEALENA